MVGGVGYCPELPKPFKFCQAMAKMRLPDKALFTLKEAGEHLALSQSSIYRLINDGQLQRVYPRQKAARITRESLVALLEKAQTPGAVRASIEQHAQAKEHAAKITEQQHQEEKKKSLADRWGLGAIFGNKAG